MSIVTVTTQGASLQKISRRLIVKTEDKKALEIPVRKVSGVVLFGNISFSNQAISLLTNNKVPVTFLSYNGSPKGQFLTFGNKTTGLKSSQYAAANHPEIRKDFIRSILAGKIKSLESFYRQFRKKPQVNFTRIKEYSSKTIAELKDVQEIGSFLGIEGSLTRAHYKLYDKLFPAGMRFEQRSKRPPENEVNALLSFGYVLLGELITSMLSAGGLDPYKGFLHHEAYNRSSLSFDLAELFRIHVIDAFVLTLVNKGIIKKEHFQQKEGFRLNNEGLQKFFSQWNKLLHGEKNNGLINQIEVAVNELIRSLKTNKTPVFGDSFVLSDIL